MSVAFVPFSSTLTTGIPARAIARLTLPPISSIAWTASRSLSVACVTTVGAARPAINEAAMTNIHNLVRGRLMVHNLERLD